MISADNVLTVQTKCRHNQCMETTALTTITTTDQNTRRPIIWNVDHMAERSECGWTHQLMVSRPKGRSTYIVWVAIEAGEIVKHSNPKKAW